MADGRDRVTLEDLRLRGIAGAQPHMGTARPLPTLRSTVDLTRPTSAGHAEPRRIPDAEFIRLRAQAGS